jgi:hypothetical protein
MVLTVSFGLSSVTGLFCHRRLADIAVSGPKGRHRLPRNLTPASGRQDHTTSPSAKAPFVRAKIFALRRYRVHRIPHPTFVTTAKRPSFGHGMAWVVKVFLPAGETNYFCAQDWTTQIGLNSLRKFNFTLQRIPGLWAERAEHVMRLIACRAMS